MILVLATVRVNPARTRALHEALKSHFDLFRAEDSCISYSVAIEDDAKGTIIAVEKWRDKRATDRHNASPES